MRAFFVTAAIIVMTILVTPFQMLAVLVDSRLARDIPILYHKIACALIGIKIHVAGKAVVDRPVLFVSNHVSWLDITVLARLLRVSFVAKKEVAGWAGFGHLAKMQRSVFIDRTRRSQAGRHSSEIENRLRAGDSLILFPEGTSTDGRLVLPFKSSLFAIAEQKPDGDPRDEITIQPITIAYTGINGMPLVRAQRPWLGWYGDMELPPHFWRVVGLGRIAVEVRFHDPVQPKNFPNRKALALYCHAQVAAGIEAAARGGADGRC